MPSSPITDPFLSCLKSGTFKRRFVHERSGDARGVGIGRVHEVLPLAPEIEDSADNCSRMSAGSMSRHQRGPGRLQNWTRRSVKPSWDNDRGPNKMTAVINGLAPSTTRVILGPRVSGQAVLQAQVMPRGRQRGQGGCLPLSSLCTMPTRAPEVTRRNVPGDHAEDLPRVGSQTVSGRGCRRRRSAAAWSRWKDDTGRSQGGGIGQ